MCGIAGLATGDGLLADDARLVSRMLEVLAHRGPDDQHAVADSHAVIGARRLSIIDLDTGRQPVSSEDGSVQASLNGEIYNYLELRADLERKGHRFTSKGDSETIPHLYEEYGARFVEHLRGMFAIAVWDAGRRRLVLARDRLGKKPLYWRLAGDRLTYGSELKALLQDSSLERTLDRRSLAQYLQYGYVPAPRSILVGVEKLPPASTLVWDGGVPRVERYWDLAYEPKTHRSLVGDCEALLEVLRESVRLRLRSDVPLGVFLSGGMDSSTVVALMAEHSPTPVKTYSIGFEEPAYDELRYARAVANYFGTSHTDEVVKLDAIALLPDLADHYDEPFADSSAIPTFRVSQLAARELKVVLTGDGGDEAFGGYRRYQHQVAIRLAARIGGPLHMPIVRAAQFGLARAIPRSRLRRRADSWRRFAERAPDERYVSMMSLTDAPQREALLGDPALADQDGYLGKLLSSGSRNELDRTLRADTLSYLPEDLLVKVDRATMANSLEARSPLLDHRLVEFAAALPEARKIQHGTTKFILRQVAYGLMPKRLVDRPKMGFGVPVGSWFKGSLGDRFDELVLAQDARVRDHLDPSVAARLIAEHRVGLADNGARLWLLLMFELWARRWLEAPRPTS
ncbi:MAG: asparagine synthase (glutamine-hydrolyzing) [Chloroflexi bacterium]|nr:asparagine synthase (glutamine-hydrolyzing) [Chloroflexota bacterium]